MGEDIIFSLLDNMETAVGGDFSKLSADNLKDMGDMLDYMEPEDFSMIPPRVVSTISQGDALHFQWNKIFH